MRDSDHKSGSIPALPVWIIQLIEGMGSNHVTHHQKGDMKQTTDITSKVVQMSSQN